MNVLKTIACMLAAALMASCGYHVGPFKRACLEGNNTFCVNMFANQSVYPMAGVQMTNAMADALQSDGTFRMASRSSSDLSVSGTVASVKASPLRTNARDSYVSDEVQLTVTVDYVVTDNHTGKVLMRGTVRESATSANQLGNVQSARDDAVSWAVRNAAGSIVAAMTTP